MYNVKTEYSTQMTVNPAPRNGGVAMENYVTWSELIQLIIAFANVGTLIVAIIALFSNKRK